MNRLWILALLAFLPAASCNTPAPSPAPVPTVVVLADAGAPERCGVSAPCDTFDSLCAHLANVPCGAGAAANCAAVLRHAASTGLTPVPTQCLLTATTPAAVRACGFVRCAQ